MQEPSVPSKVLSLLEQIGKTYICISVEQNDSGPGSTILHNSIVTGENTTQELEQAECSHSEYSQEYKLFTWIPYIDLDFCLS